MAIGGIIQIVRCKVCSLIENNEKIVRCKWGILAKHVGHKIVVHDLPWLGVKKGGGGGGGIITKDCAHLINMWLWAQWGPNSILQQVNKPSREGNWKIVQFKSLFHILSHDHPVLEYETIYDLFVSLKVPNNLSMHWFNSTGYTLVKFMY